MKPLFFLRALPPFGHLSMLHAAQQRVQQAVGSTSQHVLAEEANSTERPNNSTVTDTTEQAQQCNRHARTIKVIVIKGDAKRGRALMHPQLQILLPPVRVSLQGSQGPVGLLLTHLLRLLELAFSNHLAHLQETHNDSSVGCTIRITTCDGVGLLAAAETQVPGQAVLRLWLLILKSFTCFKKVNALV